MVKVIIGGLRGLFLLAVRSVRGPEIVE